MKQCRISGGMRNPSAKQDSLEKRMRRRIARNRGDVFLRADFSDLGSYGQVSRVLRDLLREGCLIKIVLGLYARATPSLRDGKPMPANGLRTLTDALHRLGVETTPSRAELAYNSGRSEQVPTGRVVGIRGKRIRRQIGYGGISLIFERAGPDRDQQRRETGRRADVPMAPIAVREVLHLIWEADRYPILGNEDWRHSAALERAACDRAATATMSPDDPPEFGPWLAALCSERLPPDQRDEIMEALYGLFDPRGDEPEDG